MGNPSSRLPSPRFLTAQALFLGQNGERRKRLDAYQSRQHHDRYHFLRLSRELGADLAFCRESQREVDRLLDEIHCLRLELALQRAASGRDRAIVRDFAGSRGMELELTAYCIESLSQRVEPLGDQAAQRSPGSAETHPC